MAERTKNIGDRFISESPVVTPITVRLVGQRIGGGQKLDSLADDVLCIKTNLSP